METIASCKVHWLRQQVDRGKAKKKRRGRMHSEVLLGGILRKEGSGKVGTPIMGQVRSIQALL